MRTDYFIGYGGLPAKVIYGGGRIEILSYDFDTGDFVANRMSMATLYMSQDDIERVSEPEFEAYVANLSALCHLELPRYYLNSKLPVKAIPVKGRYPDVLRFNIETDAFDVSLPYSNLVGLSGEIGRVTQADFERSLAEIRAWAAQLPSPGYYIINRQPVKLVRAEDGNPKLLGYIGRKDSFIPSEWRWRSLIPPVDSQWVCQVSETEFRQRIEAERSKFQERQQNPLTGDEQMKADRD